MKTYACYSNFLYVLNFDFVHLFSLLISHCFPLKINYGFNSVKIQYDLLRQNMNKLQNLVLSSKGSFTLNFI